MWDEFVIGGDVQETSKKNVLKAISDQDMIQEVGFFFYNTFLFQYCFSIFALNNFHMRKNNFSFFYLYVNNNNKKIFKSGVKAKQKLIFSFRLMGFIFIILNALLITDF